MKLIKEAIDLNEINYDYDDEDYIDGPAIEDELSIQFRPVKVKDNEYFGKEHESYIYEDYEENNKFDNIEDLNKEFKTYIDKAKIYTKTHPDTYVEVVKKILQNGELQSVDVKSITSPDFLIRHPSYTSKKFYEINESFEPVQIKDKNGNVEIDLSGEDGFVGTDLEEDYENSPYYNITYKVADGIFSTLVVKAGSEEEAKKIFDNKEPRYADAVIGNRKISTEEAEGLLKRGMSLLEDLNSYNQPKKIDFVHGYEIFEIKDSTSSTGKTYVAKDPKSKGVSDEAFITKSQLIDYLYENPTFESTFEDWIDEYNESLKEDFQSFKSTLGQASYGLEDWKNVIYSVLKKAGLAEGANVVFNKNSIDFTFDPKLFKDMDNKAANKLIADTVQNKMYDEFLKNGWKLGYQPSAAVAVKDKGKYEIEVQFVRPFNESLKEDFKSKEDALAYLKKKSEEDPEAAALIQAFLQLMKEPKEESLTEDIANNKGIFVNKIYSDLFDIMASNSKKGDKILDSTRFWVEAVHGNAPEANTRGKYYLHIFFTDPVDDTDEMRSKILSYLRKYDKNVNLDSPPINPHSINTVLVFDEESLTEGKDFKLGSVEDYLSQMIKAANKQAVEKIVAKAAGNPNADEAYKRWLKLHLFLQPEKKEESLTKTKISNATDEQIAKIQTMVDKDIQEKGRITADSYRAAALADCYIGEGDKVYRKEWANLHEDTQIDKIEVEVKVPEKKKSEEEEKSVEGVEDFTPEELAKEAKEIANTPNPPEAGIDTVVANELNRLIVGELNTMTDYNNFIELLVANNTNTEIVNVIKDISQEEASHIGQLQQALKQVSPNTINFEAGELEAAKQIAVPANVGDPSVDGDKPTEKELADDTLLSPEEAKEKEDE